MSEAKFLEKLRAFQNGQLNMPGIELHKKTFRYKSIEAAAKDIYNSYLNTEWGQKRAKKLGLI